jgi:hypothetical protein
MRQTNIPHLFLHMRLKSEISILYDLLLMFLHTTNIIFCMLVLMYLKLTNTPYAVLQLQLQGDTNI